MQAAEGSFNQRYPHEPNSIKDPEYSIECGVQELKAALISAEVKSLIDMENIKLALQGYNFGNGYISWARSKYGGYSYANAVEFSAQQAQRLGWSSYGDTQYPAHVLRYYPYGRAFTSGSNQAIVEVALTQLGNEGGDSLIGVGMDSRAGKNGVPVLCCGVRTSAVISKVVLFPNLQAVWMVQAGSSPIISGMIGIMSLKQETLFSLTGVTMVLLIMLESLRSVKTERFIRWKVTQAMPASKELMR